MAFQPIVNVATRSIHGYEALVRGLTGEGAMSILSHVDDTNRYRGRLTALRDPPGGRARIIARRRIYSARIFASFTTLSARA